MRRRSVMGLVLVCGCVWSWTGCGSDDDDGDATPSPSFSTLYAGYFQNCSSCHTPDAPGRTSETETALDFTSEETAYSTITTGKATGMSGNEGGCNGVPFVGDTAETSLIVAVLDETTRGSFSLSDFPDCTADAIADMTVKVGESPDAAFVQGLKDWIVEYHNPPVARE